MDLPALVADYGYPIAFFGSMLEGETILALAGLGAASFADAMPAAFAALSKAVHRLPCRTALVG